MLNKFFKSKNKEFLEIPAEKEIQELTGAENSLRKKTMLEYKRFKAIKEISIFEREIKILVSNHLCQTKYSEHKVLLREIESLLYYTLELLKDDYMLGEKFFTKKDRMTRLDDYVFSQFGRDEKLSFNIKKLKLIAFSNRFDEDPRQNLLSYFVFLEETGLDIILLLNDFNSILDISEKKSRWHFNYKSIFKFNKELYNKKEADSINLMYEGANATKMLETMMTKQAAMSPRTVQKSLLKDKIERELEQKN